jgi:hypothetical protein
MAVNERAGQIALYPEDLAQEAVRPVQGLQSIRLPVGEKRFQFGPRFTGFSQVGIGQRPPDPTESRSGGASQCLPQLRVAGELRHGALGGRPREIETADRELRVRQHGVHLERERCVVRSLGELRRLLGAREVP